MNNDGYTIERVMLDGAFNDLQRWNYAAPAGTVRGGWGIAVGTEGSSRRLLRAVARRPNEPALIEVRLDRMDCSEAVRRYGARFKAAKAATASRPVRGR